MPTVRSPRYLLPAHARCTEPPPWPALPGPDADDDASLPERPDAAWPVPATPMTGRRRPWAWAALVLGLLVALLGAAAWHHVQGQLAATRAELRAAEQRLALSEARQAGHATAMDARLRAEVTALRGQVRGALSTLAAGNAGAVRARARLEALEQRMDTRLARDPAPRAAAASGTAGADPTEVAYKRAFAHARKAVLYIRTTYTVRLPHGEDAQELTSYGTGFLISPDGVAVTAKHVLFPWRYDRKLMASQAAGMLKVDEHSVSLDVWMADRQVTTDDSADAPFLLDRAYRRDARHATVRILHVGRGQHQTEVVMTATGPESVTMPRLGRGDVAVFQLVDPTRRFPYLELSPAAHLAPLDDVMVVGFPLSRLLDGRAVPQATAGRVRRAGGSVLELDAALHPGNSGGPVLGLDGRVVGMASAILDSPVYGLAMPADELQSAWMAARTHVAAQQQRLAAQGCYAGRADGIPGPRTLAAQTCAAPLPLGL